MTIRATARVVGVTPTAAYRHFAGREELLATAKDLAVAGLAQAMPDCLASVPADGDPVRIAAHRLAALGRGYLRFALTEPGLFSTAFCLGEPLDPAEAVTKPANPYGMLADALDELVAVGYLDPGHRPSAEIGCWSAMHGLARLIVDGPLADLPERERDLTVHRTGARAPRAGERPGRRAGAVHRERLHRWAAGAGTRPRHVGRWRRNLVVAEVTHVDPGGGRSYGG